MSRCIAWKRASWPCATSTSARSLALHQLAPNHHLLNLSSSLVQPQQAHIAVEPLHLVLIDIPRSTVHLHAAVGHAAYHLGGEKLAARGLHAHFGVVHAQRLRVV